MVTEIAGPVLDRWAVHGADLIVFYDRSGARPAGLYAYEHGSGIRALAVTADFAWRQDAEGISFNLVSAPPHPKMSWAEIEARLAR
ncbi:MAG: hypothetical protein IT452_09365 [Planctomycetia bacterium]|nr:hypothetical protein [Planctomycetia bacterium]